MKRYLRWYTPWLSREFEMLVLAKSAVCLWFDDNIYFNSPYEYLPNMPDPWKYNHMGIIIGTGEWDNTRDESHRMSGILNSKGIKHWLDNGRWRGHDWNYGRDMLPYYLSLL